VSFGLGSYGLSLYGIGATAVLSVSRVFVTSERSIVVVFAAAPLQDSPIGVGDALNPGSWSLFRTDDGTVFTILSSRLYSGTTQFELYTLEKFYDYSVTHTVSAAGVVDTNRAPIVPATFGTFPGCKIPSTGRTPRGVTDFANPQSSAGAIAGNYQVDATGDYVSDYGEAFLLKIITRRLSTDPGGFFHMQNYGMGLQAKGPLQTTDLGKVKAQVDLQLSREPEFSAVSSQVSLSSSGILKIVVRAILSATNQEIAISVPVVNAVPSQ